jgi:hypothetical protein
MQVNNICVPHVWTCTVRSLSQTMVHNLVQSDSHLHNKQIDLWQDGAKYRILIARMQLSLGRIITLGKRVSMLVSRLGLMVSLGLPFPAFDERQGRLQTTDRFGLRCFSCRDRGQDIAATPLTVSKEPRMCKPLIVYFIGCSIRIRTSRVRKYPLRE